MVNRILRFTAHLTWLPLIMSHNNGIRLITRSVVADHHHHRGTSKKANRFFSSCSTCDARQDDVEIEIERKFQVTNSVIEYCESQAHHRKTMDFVDTYYDSDQYALTSKDMWLRERSGKWELKLPAAAIAMSSCDDNSSSSALEGLDFYHELSNITAIQERVRQSINVSHSSSTSASSNDDILVNSPVQLIDWLHNRKVMPFGRIHTFRNRYSLAIPLSTTSQTAVFKQNVFIDIDKVTYDPRFIPKSFHRHDGNIYSYVIGEIELAPPFAIQDRNKVMRDIFKTLQIDIKPVRGKLLEYLKVFHPKHYDALEKCGQLASKGLSTSSVANKK